MKHIIYIILFIISFNGVAQEPANRTGGFADKSYYLVDSLVLEELTKGDMELIESSLKLYHSAKDDTSKINALNDICENMMHKSWETYQILQHELVLDQLNRNPTKKQKKFLLSAQGKSMSNLAYIFQLRGQVEKALLFYSKSSRIFKSLGNIDGIANNLNNVANIYEHQGDINTALNYYHKSLDLIKETDNSEGIAISLNNVGFIYLNQGNIAEALKYWSEALSIREKNNDKKGVTESLINIGGVYYDQGEKEKALQNYYKSLKINKEIGNKRGMSHSLIWLGHVHSEQGEEEKALSYYNESLNIQKELGNKQSIANNLNNIGRVYLKMGEQDTALKYFLNSLKLVEQTGDKPSMGIILSNIGGIYLKKGLLNKAESFGNQTIQIAKELGYPSNIQNAAALLSQVYEAQNKGMKSLEMYKLHVQMKDSLNNEATQKATIRQQTKYEFEKAQIVKENEANEQTRVLAEATGRRNNLQYSLIFLGILLLFGVILSLGFIKVSSTIAEGIIFFAFLILFEFILVFTEPYLENYTNGQPMYNLLANSLLALVIFPVHAILEKLLKKRIMK